MGKKLVLWACFVLILSLAGNTSAQLLARYKFDETSGSLAIDTSGKGNDGTIEGIPVWIDGALQFDGSLSVILPASTMGLRSDTGSVVFWMNMSELTGGINTIWWGGDNVTGGGFGPENEMHIHIENFVGDIWEGGELAFHGQNNPNFHLHSDPNKGEPGNLPINPILLVDSQWHHVACTWGNEDGMVKLYLDGSLLHEIAQGSRNFALSNMYLGQMAGGGRTYTGLLNDVQIYGGALSEEEIQVIIAGSEVLSLKAALPEPANEGTEVPRDTVLNWLAGDRADTHNVYFGTNFDDVNQASITNWQDALLRQGHEDTSYILPEVLEFGQTYYWRIDEVNAPPEAEINRGNVWSFTTVNFVVVDDFEDYNDYSPDIIYETWLDGWEIETNGSTVGYADAPAAEQDIIHGGNQSMPFLYDNNMKYSETARAISDSARDWTANGVTDLSLWFKGNPPYVGGFVEESAGTFTVTGAGVDIWAESDQFHFAFKEATGASAVIAKVESLDNTDPFAKAGVMIRDTLDADSRYVGVFVTPENGVRFQYRNAVGAVTERLFAEDITAPQWVKLERTAGGLIRSSYSADGTTWTRFNLIQVAMEMPVHVGLAVTSHNAELACEARFSNVSFPGTTVGEQWTDQDVGMLSNNPEPMYVALNGTSVYHDNPDAALIEAWTQWTIPLQAFADQGVDLTNVDTLAIGFGDKNNLQAGGTGAMFFDDIRLYRPDAGDSGL